MILLKQQHSCEEIIRSIALLPALSPQFYPDLCSLLDHTRLHQEDTEEAILKFCEQANMACAPVAAMCVYPRFIRCVREHLASPGTRIASVANFPHGTHSLKEVQAEINQALEAGADEIDVVFPYQQYLAGEDLFAKQLIEQSKAACGAKRVLKVILETGAFTDCTQLDAAGKLALCSGADFLKTSTGTFPIGVTLEAACSLLLLIKEYSQQLQRPLGLKVSGGIHTIEVAAPYYFLVKEVMGESWLTPTHFRIGSSQLLRQLPHK